MSSLAKHVVLLGVLVVYQKYTRRYTKSTWCPLRCPSPKVHEVAVHPVRLLYGLSGSHGKAQPADRSFDSGPGLPCAPAREQVAQWEAATDVGVLVLRAWRDDEGDRRAEGPEHDIDQRNAVPNGLIR